MLKKDRKYYRIGEVSRIVGVEPHVLRFWEKEFRQIQPRRVSRQRLYRKQDLDTLKTIKKLLYKEGYTIAGAKKKLESINKDTSALQAPAVVPASYQHEILEEIKKELTEIKRILSG